MVERLVAISSMCYVVIEMVVKLKGASLLKTLCLVLLKNHISSYSLLPPPPPPSLSLPYIYICFLYQSLSLLYFKKVMYIDTGECPEKDTDVHCCICFDFVVVFCVCFVLLLLFLSFFSFFFFSFFLFG